jgi:uncharacterized protein involved in exopolysaccharide biosynthesis
MEKKTTEENIQEFIEKLRPYILKLWDKRKKFLIINGSVLIITLLFLLFIIKPYYESSVVILPEYGSKSSMFSQFSGLAALAGVKVGEAAPTEIYQNLLQSESVMAPVINSRYLTKEYPDSVNLIQYFEIDTKDKNPEIQKRTRFLVVNKLFTNALISTDLDRITKILTIKVTMPEAQLSADVVNKIVESLDFYIRTKRKSYVSEQRYYLEKRVEQVKDSLGICENKLRDFREQNRMIVQSPNLLLEQGRLMRNVEILQTVYIELTKQLELAKIDEIKDTPILNIKEDAQNPIIKVGPKRLLILILILFFSVLASGSYLLYEDIIKKTYKYFRSKNKINT